MQKIQTMYERDETKRGHPVKIGVKPECAWVEDGEGTPTHKLDGTNVKIQDGALYRRQKPKDRDYDDAAYVMVDPADPSNRWIMEAFLALGSTVQGREDGIYEAVGPKIQGNPENYEVHRLVRVVPPCDSLNLGEVPRDFNGLRDYFLYHEIEGIVFHHPDGRLAKIKRWDFGLSWPLRA